MRSSSSWQRVSKRRPCPVCGKPDWCVYVGDEDAPEAAICARVESPRRCGEAGWLHRLRDGVTAWPRWQSTIRRAVRRMHDAAGDPDVAAMATQWRLPAGSPRLAKLAGDLGVSPESLFRLGVGWSDDRQAWSFPMRDAAGAIVGIRLRLPTGKKLSVKGGREGLFLPEGPAGDGRLLVCEGPTDTAALLDLGQSAVGRPSCTGGVAHVVALVRRRRPAEVVVVADGDAPGLFGAEKLAAVLLAYCLVVRVIGPPRGIKDARDWKRQGATAADVAAAIDAAPVRRLAVRARKAGGRHGA